MNKELLFKNDYSLEQMEVYKLLTMPIISEKYSKGQIEIIKGENRIISTQTYFPYKNKEICLDPDMSDFAF